MSETRDTDLFEVWATRISESDEGAFEAFFRAMHTPLVRFANSLVHDDASASDLVQDAFVRLWETRQRLDPTLSLKALAYRTVRNLALNRIRDRKKRADLLDTDYRPEVTPPPRPDDIFGEAALANELRGWIDDLPDRQKEALRLSRFDGLNHDEIAEAMGLSARTVNNHLVKALRTIRDRIRTYEPTLLDS